MESGRVDTRWGMLEDVVLSRHRAMVYLRSRQNRVGCALALLAAGLSLADPVGPAGLALVVAFYLLGAAAARPNPAIGRFGFDPKDVLKRLHAEIAAVSGRVPPEIVISIQRIELIIRTEVLPRLELLPPGSVDLYLIERTATDYLPTAIERYLRLPAAYSVPSTGGRTAYDVLLDELDILELGMQRVAETVRRSDMDRLLAHRRFLNDRFAGLDPSA